MSVQAILGFCGQRTRDNHPAPGTAVLQASGLLAVARKKGTLGGTRPASPEAKRAREQEREIERLQRRTRKAGLIIDIQRKLGALLVTDHLDPEE